jgi:acetyl-CoA acetyltransferase
LSDTSQFPRAQAAIAGIGCTEFSKDSGMSTFGLAARAIKTAVADAGLELSDIDGLATFGPGDSIPPNTLAQGLGIPSMNWFLDQYLGGSVSLSVIGTAALAVASGVADCVVCYRALNGRSEQRMNASGAGAKQPWDVQYKMETGYVVPAQEMGMAARAHMERYGTTNEDFGRLAIMCRNHALDNERAMMRDRPMTMDDYLASPWISEPFRVFDCCLETDGAVALVIVNAERAKDAPHRPVYLQGAAWGGGVSIYSSVADLADSPAKPIAKRLWANAGIGPADLDFAELYDCFTFTLLAQIEGYELAEPGGVPDMLKDGAFDRAGGSMPVNTAGGLLSEGFLHGFNHVYEAVEQIRGEAAHRQVANHDTALVAGQLGYISAYSSALVLAGA